MPSQNHKNKIAEISQEINSRSQSWRTKKNYPIWMPQDNQFGLIDIVGFKSSLPNQKAEVEGYEIEEANGQGQIARNREKLEQLKKSFPPETVQVTTCQLTAEQDHRQVCPKPIVSKLSSHRKIIRIRQRM